MKKEEARKEFFKLKNWGHSYSQCRKILLAQFGFETTSRTLQRWAERLSKTEWDLTDKSTKPKNTHCKINSEIENKIVSLKKKTGFGENKLETYFDLGHTTINKILNKHSLCKESKSKGKRIKYIRWQRNHPNSLWQIDHTCLLYTSPSPRDS